MHVQDTLHDISARTHPGHRQLLTIFPECMNASTCMQELTIS